jgi:hypothetical protein
MENSHGVIIPKPLLAEVGDGGLVWPEFGSDADKDPKW